MTPLIAGLALAAAALAIGLQLALGLPELPDPLASHFGASGRADGWMSHGAYVAVQLAMLVATGLVFGAIGWLSTRPGAPGVNIPNRDYWFAPERHARSSSRLCAAMLWLQVIAMGFIAAINQLVFAANRRPEPELSASALIAGVLGLGLAIGVWALALRRSFRRS